MNKHEIIPCERCGKRIECKASSYAKCECSSMKLNLNEVQYISENYEGPPAFQACALAGRMYVRILSSGIKRRVQVIH